jgi:hypothetical protein
MRPLIALSLVTLALSLGTLTQTPVVAQPTSPQIGGCPVFPTDNIWNARVDNLPLDPRSNDYINSIGANTGLHPDFGTFYLGAPIGIPYVVVPASQPTVPISYIPPPNGYEDESDPGPMPIPPDAPVEGGNASTGDRHVLVLRQGECKLYELFNATKQTDNSWRVASSAVFDLNSNALRPEGWTSADAAGLPILPGLIRYDEVKSGEIKHAIRFAVTISQRKYVWPGRHFASSNTSPTRPPMGQRFRLKASVDISKFPADIQVIFTAFKRYGIIVSDNGSNWFIIGAHDTRWDDDMLVTPFRQLKGSDFEAVDVSSLMVNKDSGQVKSGGAPPTVTPSPTAGPSPTPFVNVTPRAFAPLMQR